MGSIKMANFFLKRIQQTIAYKQYIKTVNISFGYSESYGNEYIKVSYSLLAHQSFKKLPFKEQEFIFQGSPNYIFSLVTHAANGSIEKKKKLLRIIEFKSIYESLTTNAVIQLEHALDPNTTIKAQAIDVCPWANYAEQYVLIALKRGYRIYNLHNYEVEVWQWKGLHQLRKKSRKLYETRKKDFNVMDTTLSNHFGIEHTDLRRLLLYYQVPISFKGIKTINEVNIHTDKLVEALKKEISVDDNNNSWKEENKTLYKSIITYLYDHHLLKEKQEIIHNQQYAFLKGFTIQQGDVLELTDKRLVIVSSLYFENEFSLMIKYTMLKNNLQPGERSRAISIDKVTYILKASEFLEYFANSSVKHLSLLGRWMEKRKKRVLMSLFEPDFFQKERHQ